MLSKKNIILLHGWGFSSGVWKSLIPLLNEHFSVTAIDLPGYGNTPACDFAEAPTPNQLMESVVEKVLSQAPDKAIWMGWSLGGLIATYIAKAFPHRVEMLINVASSPCFVSQEDWPGMQLDILEQFSQSLLTDHQETLTRFIALQFLGCEQPKQLLQNVKPQLESCGKVSLQTLQQGLQLLKYTDLRTELQTLQIPLLHVLGRLDMLVPVKVAPKLEALNRFGQTIVVDKAAHAPFLSHPEYFTEILKNFIKKQDD